VEVAHTGTTAISRELRENYDGSPILRKHAHYSEFLKVASPEEKDYFVFASIRNPLDEAVSLYFKYRTNHKRKFTRAREIPAKQGKTSLTNTNLRIFNFIQETGADFSTFFRKTYKLPYTNVRSVCYKSCDFVIRFENIQADFAKALELIGIEAVRPLPQVNKTSGRERNFSSYYTPEIIDQAKKVFGPFMRRWGYEFPAGWGEESRSWWNDLEFYGVDTVRSFYWKHLRRSPAFYGRLIRRFI
jgi:hypothetical protein